MYSHYEEKDYSEKSQFLTQRYTTCEYRFLRMNDARYHAVYSYEKHKDIKLFKNQIQTAANTYVNCLAGYHDQVGVHPDLENANQFMISFYTRLLPKYVLERQRHKLGIAVFNLVKQNLKDQIQK